MPSIRRHISYANVASTLAVIFAMGGGAYAALGPVRGGVVHSCYRKATGALRVVRTTARCTRQERALNFNRRGPTGSRGPEGPTGATGLTGAVGATGSRGRRGKDGASVTSIALAAGNATCPNGGSSFTTTSATTYACNGTAAAFASVSAAATLASGRNVTAVALGTTPGVYCLKLALTPSVGIGSVRGDSATPGSAEVLIPASTVACGACGDTTAEVLTYNHFGTPAGLPFDVVFD